MSKKGAIIVVLAIVVSIALLVALIQLRPQLGPDNGQTIVANTTEPGKKEIINVLSTRSAFPFVQRWTSQYNNDDSSLGRAEVRYFLEEPSGTEDLVIAGNVENASSRQSIPVSAQAAAIVYNIPSFPDIPSGMKLNASLLSQIFNGSITLWNDPAIRDLNPSLNLPSERIVVIHESSNSSTLGLLERYLSSRIEWPDNSIQVLGPDELATLVRTTPYSIGYVDFSYATQTRMTFASLKVGNNFVLPSMDSIQRTITMSLQNVTINATTIIVINSSRIDNSSYPLTGFYYAIPHHENKNATIDFIRWLIDENEGQPTLIEVQYPPIYKDNESLTSYARSIINSTVPRGTKG